MPRPPNTHTGTVHLLTGYTLGSARYLRKKTRKKRQLALQCHLRLPVSPVVLAFNHEAGSEIISVSNFNTIGQCTAESLAIQRMFSARILTLYTQS